MKVLIVNCVYGQGSTGKIVADLHQGLLQSGVETRVCYARGAVRMEAGVRKLAPELIMKLQSLSAKITGYVYQCSPFSTKALFSYIESERPDLVNLHCINANTLNMAAAISRLKKLGIPTVLSIHAEFPYTGGCAHALDCDRWKTGCYDCPQFRTVDSHCPESFFFDRSRYQWMQLQKAYDKFDRLLITCVSPWLTDRARQSPFFRAKTVLSVLNGLNTEIFTPRDATALKHKHGLTSEKIILHVTPNFYSAIKGGEYVLDIARRLEKEHPRYRLIIVGYNGDGSDLPSNVIPVAFTKDQVELAEYYSLADLTLLTSQKETFSMICAESLCCGTPIVGFKAGGPESIALPEYSCFTEYPNTELLYEILLQWLDRKAGFEDLASEAKQAYSTQNMTEQYISAYRKALNYNSPYYVHI